MIFMEQIIDDRLMTRMEYSNAFDFMKYYHSVVYKFLKLYEKFAPPNLGCLSQLGILKHHINCSKAVTNNWPSQVIQILQRCMPLLLSLHCPLIRPCNLPKFVGFRRVPFCSVAPTSLYHPDTCALLLKIWALTDKRKPSCPANAQIQKDSNSTDNGDRISEVFFFSHFR